MSSFKSHFDKTIYLLKEILGPDSALLKEKVRPGPKHKFTDLEVIALSITAADLGHESESYIIRLMGDEDFPNLISRRQYNHRRHQLNKEISELHTLITQKINAPTDKLVADSTPVPICRNSREKWLKACKDNPDCLPNKSYCASQKMYYVGFKLHLVVSLNGVVQYFKISPATEDDRKIYPDMVEKFSNCILIGDMGYLGEKHEKYLYEKAKIVLKTPYRENQKNKPQQEFEYHDERKIIESIFKNLKAQYKLELNYAKTFKGLMTRIQSKLCSFALSQYVNEHKLPQKSTNETLYALIDWKLAG